MDILSDIYSPDSKEYTYKDYILHDFQAKAINYVKLGQNVMVIAGTGNGKTLIADAAIELCKREGKKLIYTSPLIALSEQKLKQFSQEDEKDFINEKYMELREKHGYYLVGLITGDRVINPNAPILVMTTEICCVMLYDQTKTFENTVKCIVVDETQNISDKYRGTIYEEIFMMKPKNCIIVGLSGTFPNGQEFCDYLSSIYNEKVNLVTHKGRLVPLSFSYFHKDFGPCSHQQLKKELSKRKKGDEVSFTSHIDFVKYAVENDLLNVFGFFNSRRACETNAEELCETFDFLSDNDKKSVEQLLLKYNNKYPELQQIKSWKLFEKTAMQGIGFYHSGLVPIIKSACQEFLKTVSRNVTYGTDAMGQGTDNPIRSEFMESLKDPVTGKMLLSSKFLQRAGRAGRQGSGDEKGDVCILANMKSKDIVDLNSIRSEDIQSQLRLPFNRVIRHLNRDMESFIKRSFASYQHKNKMQELKTQKELIKNQLNEKVAALSEEMDCSEFNNPKCPIVNKELKKKQLTRKGLQIIRCTRHENKCLPYYNEIKDLKEQAEEIYSKIDYMAKNDPVVKFPQEFNRKKKLLKHLNFIDENNILKYKGQLCSKIFVEELLVSELIERGFFYDNDVDAINAYLSGIVYRKNSEITHELKGLNYSAIDETVEFLSKQAKDFNITYTPHFNKHICPIIYSWSKGNSLESITDKCDMFEGDIIKICKDVILLLNEIKNACSYDKYTVDKADKCIERLSRDIVSLSF